MTTEIMIDFENKRIFCSFCGRFLPSTELFIDGTHGVSVKTTHKVWEKP